VRTLIEQTLRALDDLQQQSKILYPAVSNWAAWQIATALGISAREGLARFELIQPMYNLVRRQGRSRSFPWPLRRSSASSPNSPLGGGLLTGKYATSERPESGRLIDDPRYVSRYSLETDFATADRSTEFAQKLDIKPATLAVAWTMLHPDVTAAIRNLTQLEDSLAALDVEMTNDLRGDLRAIASPAPATDRTETLKPN
jgi:aryl-alcohol dehydrogenase-like predicted oxidoreductase